MAGRSEDILARRGEIMLGALGMDYAQFERTPIAFDYEGMMASHGYSLDDIVAIQRKGGVGDTPLLELRNLTDLVRSMSSPGMGARTASSLPPGTGWGLLTTLAEATDSFTRM